MGSIDQVARQRPDDRQASWKLPLQQALWEPACPVADVLHTWNNSSVPEMDCPDHPKHVGELCNMILCCPVSSPPA